MTSGGLTCGHGNFVSGAIRWLTRFRGEAPVFTNHAFVLLSGGRSGAESLFKGVTEFSDYRDRYDNQKSWCVTFECVPTYATRPGTFNRAAIDAKLKAYVGREYDFWCIAKAALDGLASKVVGRDVFLFRRLRVVFWKRQERWNICSWLFCWTHEHGGWRVWGHVTHTEKKQRGTRLRLTRVIRFEPLPCSRVTPNDIERDVFLERPYAYRITDECGRRPRGLPASYRHKIETDLSR